MREGPIQRRIRSPLQVLRLRRGQSGEVIWSSGWQREAAALFARGLTNRQIAADLVITRRTAESHVAGILTKLDIASRAQIAVWAAAQGLLSAPR